MPSLVTFSSRMSLFLLSRFERLLTEVLRYWMGSFDCYCRDIKNAWIHELSALGISAFTSLSTLTWESVRYIYLYVCFRTVCMHRQHEYCNSVQQCWVLYAGTSSVNIAVVFAEWVVVLTEQCAVYTQAVQTQCDSRNLHPVCCSVRHGNYTWSAVVWIMKTPQVCYSEQYGSSLSIIFFSHSSLLLLLFFFFFFFFLNFFQFFFSSFCSSISGMHRNL